MLEVHVGPLLLAVVAIVIGVTAHACQSTIGQGLAPTGKLKRRLCLLGKSTLFVLTPIVAFCCTIAAVGFVTAWWSGQVSVDRVKAAYRVAVPEETWVCSRTSEGLSQEFVTLDDEPNGIWVTDVLGNRVPTVSIQHCENVTPPGDWDKAMKVLLGSIEGSS